MNKLDLERYKKEKEEYDKKIRSLDYKVVETSVEMYNEKSHTSQLEEDDEYSKVNQLKNKINEYELEKFNLTQEIWKKVLYIKDELRKIINNKIEQNPSEKNNYLIAIFKLNKITDVYFDVDELIELSYLLEDVPNEINIETIEAKTKGEKLNDLKQLTNNKEVIRDDSKEASIALGRLERKENINKEKEQVMLIKNENSLIPINAINNLAMVPKIAIEEELDNKEENSVNQSDENNLDNNIDKIEKLNSIQPFNIEEQRVIDFENLLNHIEKNSKDYRTDIERSLERFISNYKVVRNIEYLQNDFDNITNNYLEIFKEIISRFKKDESLEALESRIKAQEEEIKELDKKILNSNIEIKEFQRIMQELSKVHFVKNYVKKVQQQLAKAQGSQESSEDTTINVNNIFVPQKENNIENVENNVFLRIKKLSYNKRMNHIIEVSKWTNNIEEKIKYSEFDESDFQFLIYLIRQTENVCNSHFEQIANLIINFCDFNLQLEDVEKKEKSKNKKIEDETIISQILKVGIDNIKKRYSKIPFIGRKVTSILSVKMLDK